MGLASGHNRDAVRLWGGLSGVLWGAFQVTVTVTVSYSHSHSHSAALAGPFRCAVAVTVTEHLCQGNHNQAALSAPSLVSLFAPVYMQTVSCVWCCFSGRKFSAYGCGVALMWQRCVQVAMACGMRGGLLPCHYVGFEALTGQLTGRRRVLLLGAP